MSKKDRNKLLSALVALAAIVVLMSLTIRFLSGSETLEDYARTHPEEQTGPVVTPDIIPVTDEPDAQEQSSENAADAKKTGDIKDTDIDTEDIEAKADTEDEKPALAETAASPERVTYADGFYYEPIPDVIRDKMKGVSYPLDIDETKVSFDVLRYVRLKYIDFDGNEAEGEMVCNMAIARDIVEIFHELYVQGYQIQSIRLIDDYDADDTASMLDNNTSCFCYRVVDGSTHLSNHAYGRAVDLNPFYNPYIVYGKGENGGDYISPEGSEIYTDRTADFPHKIDENDLAYKLFKQHGFKWGGDWNTMKDYQHFEKKA